VVRLPGNRYFKQGKVTVEVQDSGVGIDLANAGMLFKAFFTTKRGGLGIGLSISRSLIEVHNGHLTVDTDAAAGAIFQFQLPSHDRSREHF
jgi:signal transduction histidine kinase